MPVPRGSAWPEVAGEPVLCCLLGVWLWAIPVPADAAKRTAARRATYFIVLSPWFDVHWHKHQSRSNVPYADERQLGGSRRRVGLRSGQLRCGCDAAPLAKKP